MQTFLILSENKDFIEKEISRFKKDLRVSSFDIRHIYPDDSIGIGQVRNLIKDCQTTAYNSQNRLIVINQIDKATVQAQNALLKFLEESTPATTIILTSDNEKNILPTVLSRSQTIKETKPFFKKVSDPVFYNSVRNLFTYSASEKLNFVQKEILQKEHAFLFVRKLTDLLQTELLNPSRQLNINRIQITKLLIKASSVRQFLDLNVNYKLVLDVLLLGFPRSTDS